MAVQMEYDRNTSRIPHGGHMSNRLISGEQVGMSESADSQNLSALGGRAGPADTAPAQSTYVPTGVKLIDSLLVTVDDMTHGKAGVLQRAVSYLMVGGFAAVVNLTCLYLFYERIPVPAAWQAAVPAAWYTTVHYTVAYLLATEISIMANFIPNDRITFSHLPGHSRSWLNRCLRFHSTCIGGTLVTYVISLSLHTWAGWPALAAQATGIWIGLVFNFTFHHLWTYRHVEPAS
jgi:putative flippase GtrA